MTTESTPAEPGNRDRQGDDEDNQDHRKPCQGQLNKANRCNHDDRSTDHNERPDEVPRQPPHAPVAGSGSVQRGRNRGWGRPILRCLIAPHQPIVSRVSPNAGSGPPNGTSGTDTYETVWGATQPPSINSAKAKSFFSKEIRRLDPIVRTEFFP